MNNPLKIAVIADPFIPVPPLLYGGIERIIDFLVNGLTAKGHEVMLVAHPGSVTDADLLAYSSQDTIFKHVKNINTVNKLKKFKPDIIHSFGRLAYLLPFLPSNTPKIMSYQRKPTISQVKRAVRLSKKGSLCFTGCSNYISNQIKPYAPAETIYNGVELSKYSFRENIKEDAPLVFLGRIEPVKGTHLAIEIAQLTKKNLLIAGNVPVEHESYFNNRIAPFIGDQIRYAGSVNDIQKNEILGNALALLMPIEWDEPFGIVMAEAMACGTPVLGLKRGAVPEVIEQSINGFYAQTAGELAECVAKVSAIDRKKVRAITEQRFSSLVIVKEYEALYKKLIG